MALGRVYPPYRVREMQLDDKAGLVVSHFDPSVVKIGDGGDEAETETAAGAVPARLEAIKAPQNMLALLDRDTESTIGY